MVMTPVIGLVCFAVILADWFGGVRYFGGVPGGLVATLADGESGTGLFRKILLTSTDPTVAPRTLDLDWRGGGPSELFPALFQRTLPK